MLPSFEIERFRTFSHLMIPRLGRVNLITGRNNVGKTMLLEALRFYGSGGDPKVLGDLLAECDEVYAGQEPVEGRGERFLRLESLFHGRDPVLGPDNAMRLGILGDDPLALRVELAAFPHVPYDRPLGSGAHKALASSLSEGESSFSEEESSLSEPDVVPGISVFQGERKIHALTSQQITWSRNSPRPFVRRFGASPAFVSAAKIDFQHMAWQWDAIALKEGEERVRECLRIIGSVDRIIAVGNPRMPGRRMFKVRVEQDVEPVPLKSLGDGMIRVLRIALALETAAGEGMMQRELPLFDELKEPMSGRMLLIDEVENGIHHAVLPDLWRFLIKVAKLRDLQVFAATHSWDCVEAFQYAASKEEDSNAVLIRLEKKGDANRAVIFADDQLPIVTRHGIEVR